MIDRNTKVKNYSLFNLIFLVFISSLVACNEPEMSIPTPDVSHVNPQIKLQRLDSLFALSDKKQAVKEIEKFQLENPAFANIFFKQLVPIFSEDKDEFKNRLTGFLSSDQISNLADTTQIVFPNLNGVRKDLKKGMQYYQHYFPEASVPNFYSLISEFGIQSFIFQDGDTDGVGIGLDMFLGEDFNYKRLDPRNPAFSDYLTDFYTKENIVKRSVEVILEDRLGTLKGSNLLSQMVNEGKKLYILRYVLPFVSEDVVLGYRPEQLEWLENNEIEMWSFFLEKELLYETSNAKTFKYLNPSPNSPGMPEQAPGRTGAYVGFKIVENYMKRNPSTSMQQLIEQEDYQKMINKYKPRRGKR